MDEPADLALRLALVRTEAYLDAHPALAQAVCESLHDQRFMTHGFGARPENRVYADWCDPRQRRAMEIAFEDAQRRAADPEPAAGERPTRPPS